MEGKQQTGLGRQFVVFTIGSQEFGVEIAEVREVIRLTAVTRLPDMAPHVRGVITLRGRVVTVIDLATRLDLPNKPADEDTRIIIIEHARNSIGMIVDSAKEVLRIPSDLIQPPPPILTNRINSRYIQGVGLLDQRLLILLNLAQILEDQDLRGVPPTVPATVPAAVPPEPPLEPDPAPQPGEPETAAEVTPGLAAPLPPALASESIQPARTPPPTAPPHQPPPAPCDEPSALPDLPPTPPDVPPEQCFITHDGQPLKNLLELLGYVCRLDEATFRQFVNADKNDFRTWIAHVVQDQVLADKLQGLTAKDDLIQALQDRLS